MRAQGLVMVLVAVGVAAAPAAARGNGVGISSISPTEGFRGDVATIAGNGFGAENVRVSVGGVEAKVLAANGHSIRFTVPRGAPLGETVVRETNPGGQSATIGFRVRFDGTVSTTIDTTRTVTVTVGPAGGTVAAGGSTLTIPRGALPDDQQITMTPLRALDGSPFDRLLGGVKLGPDGLTFIKPATLTVQLPSGIDPSQLFGFAFEGSGTEFHLVPSQVAGDELSIPIWHFSGGGAAAGGASAISTMLDYTPTRTAHDVEQNIALSLNTGLQGAGPEIAFFLRLWYDDTVLKGLQAALGQDETSFEQAVGEWQAWLTDAQLYGDLPATTPATGQTVRDVLLSRIVQAQAAATDDAAALASATLGRCTGVDFLSPLKSVFRLAGILEVLGLPVAGRPTSVGRPLPDTLAMPAACAHVKIDHVAHPPAFAISGENTFTADAGLVSWNGPERYDIPLDVELDDTRTAPIALASDSVADGHWETTVTPRATGSLPLEFDANLAAAAQDTRLGALGDNATFTVDVRKRVELHSSATIRPGAGITLVALTAGDGMANAAITYSLIGAGSLTAMSGTTNAAGSTSVGYTASPNPAGGVDRVTATFGSVSDSATITIKPPITVTVKPQTVTLHPGDTLRFTATVTNATDPTVTWGATGGTIDATGLYKAGVATGTFAVVAASNEDASATDTVVVKIDSALPVTKISSFGVVEGRAIAGDGPSTCGQLGGGRVSPAGLTDWTDTFTCSASDVAPDGTILTGFAEATGVFNEFYSGTDLIAIDASGDAFADGTGSIDTFGVGGTDASYNLTFSVGAPVHVTIDADITGNGSTGAGTVFLKCFSPSGSLTVDVEVETAVTANSLHQTVALPAGRCTFNAEAGASGDAIVGSGKGSFLVTLLFGF